MPRAIARLRATRYARAFDLSGRAAGLFYHGFSQIWADLYSIVLICAKFVLICVFICNWWLWRWIFMVQKKCNRAFGAVASLMLFILNVMDYSIVRMPVAFRASIIWRMCSWLRVSIDTRRMHELTFATWLALRSWITESTLAPS